MTFLGIQSRGKERLWEEVDASDPDKRAEKSNELRKPTGSDRSAGKAEGENVRR